MLASLCLRSSNKSSPQDLPGISGHSLDRPRTCKGLAFYLQELYLYGKTSVYAFSLMLTATPGCVEEPKLLLSFMNG